MDGLRESGYACERSADCTSIRVNRSRTLDVPTPYIVGKGRKEEDS